MRRLFGMKSANDKAPPPPSLDDASKAVRAYNTRAI